MKFHKFHLLGATGAMLAGFALQSAPAAIGPGATRHAPGIAPQQFSAQGETLKFSWDPKASPYIELAFNRPNQLPRFANATVRMKFKAPAGTPVNRMGLRLLDAKGETFQYTVPVTRAADGTLDAVWEITPSTRFESWGDNADKVLDQPARINAFTIDYDGKAAPTELELTAIDVETQTGAADSPFKVMVDRGMKKYVPGAGAPVEQPYVELPNGSGKGVEITWDPTKSKYIEMVFNQAMKLPEYSKLTVNAKFYAPAGCPVRNIGLRLTDATNETFQFSKAANFQSGGIIDVTWEVPQGKWPNSWGGNADHQFDQPGKIYGFGVDYAQTGTEAKFYLISMDAQISGGATLTATRQLYGFDLSNKFGKNWGSGNLSLGKDGLLISGISGETSINERMNDLTFYHSRPVKLQLDALLNAGKMKAYWVLRDAANKEYRTPELALKQGSNKLDFNLTELLKDAKLPIRVERLAFVNDGPAPGSVLLTSGKIGTAQPLVEAVDFEVLTGNDIHVLKSGEEEALKFQFTNTSNQPGNFTFDLAFSSFSGKNETRQYTAALKPGETVTVDSDWKPAEFGHWDIKTTVREASDPKMSASSTRSFAYLEPAGPTPGRAPGFLFSICTHTSRWSQVDQFKEIEAAALCGTKVIRDGVEWGGIQPERDVWNFDQMDFLVNQYGKVGIELQAMFAFTAKWAAPVERQNSKNWLDWNRCAPEINAWREYVRTMVDRYRGRIRYWEVWNEPDLSGFNQMTLAEYVERQKAAYEEAGKVAPEAIIMTGGFATMTDHPGKKSPTFHRDYLNDAKGSFKVHAYHEHGSFAQFADVVDGKFLPMRAETNTTVPWYANETAINSMNGSERNQAVTLFKKLLFAWSRGAIGYTWYDLRNDGFDPLDGEHNYGMITNDFYPKPVYSTFNMMAGVYRNAKYVKQFDLGPNLWAFEFTADGNTLIPAWDESGFGSALTLVVKSNAQKAYGIDLMGNRTEQAVLDGMTLLEVTPMPYTLMLDGAESAEIAGRLLEIAAGGIAVPGRPYQFTVKVLNPLSAEHTFNLALADLPTGFAAKQMTQSITVPANGTAEAKFDFTVGSDFKPSFGNPEKLQVAYTLSDTPWKGSLAVPVNAAVAIPSKAHAKPDFVLDKRTQVVSLTAADPALNHRVWRGADDLSAKVFLGETDGNFTLKAEVTDDKHSQPHSGMEVWQGDNIQFAFQLPGQPGYWELGLSRLDSGKSEIFVFQTPRGFTADAGKAMKLVTRREGSLTTYELTIPEAAIGMTPEIARNGFRFNLLVNDNDGEGRDGWIHIAPGIGENKNPEKFPFIVFE